MAEILLPVGRMIGGSLYKPQPRTDNFGKPKIGKDGKPETGFNFGVAIPKMPGHTHWAQTDWGAQIRAVGVAASPGICDTPSFAWKITDGDSQIPNKKNRRPCDQEGYPGHWVMWFGQSWAPKICNANGTQELTDPDVAVPGDWVQVFTSVKSNLPSPTPGVYLNPLAVAFVGYHQNGRIVVSSVDTAAVGFGQAPLPPGVTATPPAQMAPPSAVAVPTAPQYAPPPTVPAAYIPPVPAAPNTAIFHVPVVPPTMPGAAPAAPGYSPAMTAAPNATYAMTSPSSVPPPPPPAPAGRAMLPAANGATYEQYVASGWSDAQLIANGLMAA